MAELSDQLSFLAKGTNLIPPQNIATPLQAAISISDSLVDVDWGVGDVEKLNMLEMVFNEVDAEKVVEHPTSPATSPTAAAPASTPRGRRGLMSNAGYETPNLAQLINSNESPQIIDRDSDESGDRDEDDVEHQSSDEGYDENDDGSENNDRDHTNSDNEVEQHENNANANSGKSLGSIATKVTPTISYQQLEVLVENKRESPDGVVAISYPVPNMLVDSLEQLFHGGYLSTFDEIRTIALHFCNLMVGRAIGFTAYLNAGKSGFKKASFDIELAKSLVARNVTVGSYMALMAESVVQDTDKTTLKHYEKSIKKNKYVVPLDKSIRKTPVPLKEHLRAGTNETLMHYLTHILAAYNVLNQVTFQQISLAAPFVDLDGKIKTCLDTHCSEMDITEVTTVIHILEFVQTKRVYEIVDVLKPLQAAINGLNDANKAKTVAEVLPDVLNDPLWEDHDDYLASMLVSEFVSKLWEPYIKEHCFHVIPDHFLEMVMLLTDKSIWDFPRSNSSTLATIVKQRETLWKNACGFDMFTGEQGECKDDGIGQFSKSTAASKKNISNALSSFQGMLMQENISSWMFGQPYETDLLNSSLLIRPLTASIAFIRKFDFNQPETFINPSTRSLLHIDALIKLTSKASNDKFLITKERRKKKVFFISLLGVTDGDDNKLTKTLESFRYFDKRKE
jgi:hypothetical protein